MDLAPPPPAALVPDDPHAADPARRRIKPKSSFRHFLASASKLPNKAVKASATRPPPDLLLASPNLETPPEPPITLDASNLNLPDHADRYEWAVVYENQRGMTMFSIPYYSRLSLLPMDPAPFTIPSTSSNPSKHVPVTLQHYPLPDGAWRWVSKAWMIDMRSDSGEVQHDGFEYNWLFRSHNWRAEVGPLSAGGFVRRRRWVRLMMRPPATSLEDDTGVSDQFVSDNGLSLSQLPAEPPKPFDRVADIWLDDDVEMNWSKCRTLMKMLGRDGPRLELWESWLLNSVARQCFESSADIDSRVLRAPRKEQLRAVLQRYGRDLFGLYVYPASRAKMVKMLGDAGLLNELETDSSWFHFWSYLVECGLRSE